VFDSPVAIDVTASQNSREMAGFLQIAATAAPGRTLIEIDRAIAEETARLAQDGPTDVEIDRVRVQAESHFIFRLQTVGGFGGKSDQLNAYNVLVGDPAYFDRDLARYTRATSASVREAVALYLSPAARRVALSVVPRGGTDLALPDSVPAAVS
jgi:zinc protease